ncbi:MAG: hypothetical protein LBJ43_05345 [Propionibacteriaceae bacterium]|jgi:serine/threonine protein kinase|nr:hypothetical protein [Propionibacteriaceae bacterium]
MAKNVFDDPQLSPQLPSGEVTFGQVLGARYRLDEQLLTVDEIGLWRGWDEQLSRIVLLYVLPPNHPRTTAVLNAARVASQAVDARFLRVLDALEYGPSEPASFVVCECVPGYHLQAVLTAGPIGSLAATWLTSEIAKALLPLHAERLSHGLLNPDSVVITTNGNIKISGFLLDSVLGETSEKDTDTTWEEREAVDVSALGQLLYASLTGHWPIVTSADSDFGLPVVYRDTHGIPAPSELRSGVPQILDVICTQILAPKPDNPQLDSVQDVVTALAQVLGAADATEDLAYRVRALAVVAEPATTRPSSATATDNSNSVKVFAPPPGTDPNQILDDYEDSSAKIPIVGETPTQVSPAANPDVAAHLTAPTADAAPVAPKANVPSPAGVSADASSSSGVAVVLQRPLRFLLTQIGKVPLWQLGLGVLLIILVLFFVIKNLFGGDTAAPPGGVEVKTDIAAVSSFDPTADGGSGDECDEMVGNAIDGNPTTRWECNYYDSAKPTMKPGFGLLLTLPSEQLVTAIGLQVPNAGATVQIMVPNADKLATDGAAPTDSVQSWHEVGGGQLVNTSARFVLTEPVKTKYVLIYATELADVGNWQYEFVVTETTVYVQQ